MNWESGEREVAEGELNPFELGHVVDWSLRPPTAERGDGEAHSVPHPLADILRWTAGLTRYQCLTGRETTGPSSWSDCLLGPTPNAGSLRSTSIAVSGRLDGLGIGCWSYDPFADGLRPIRTQEPVPESTKLSVVTDQQRLRFKYSTMSRRLGYLDAGAMAAQLEAVARLEGTFTAGVTLGESRMLGEHLALSNPSTVATLDLSSALEPAPLPGQRSEWAYAIASRRSVRGGFRHFVRAEDIDRTVRRAWAFASRWPGTVRLVLAAAAVDSLSPGVYSLGRQGIGRPLRTARDDGATTRIACGVSGISPAAVVIEGDYHGAFETGVREWYQGVTVLAGAWAQSVALAAASTGLGSQITCSFPAQQLTTSLEGGERFRAVALVRLGPTADPGGYELPVSVPPAAWSD